MIPRITSGGGWSARLGAWENAIPKIPRYKMPIPAIMRMFRPVNSQKNSPNSLALSFAFIM
jgi:hypothetical protein